MYMRPGTARGLAGRDISWAMTKADHLSTDGCVVRSVELLAEDRILISYLRDGAERTHEYGRREFLTLPALP